MVRHVRAEGCAGVDERRRERQRLLELALFLKRLTKVQELSVEGGTAFRPN
jgi:hypothetical protein